MNIMKCCSVGGDVRTMTDLRTLSIAGSHNNLRGPAIIGGPSQQMQSMKIINYLFLLFT